MVLGTNQKTRTQFLISWHFHYGLLFLCILQYIHYKRVEQKTKYYAWLKPVNWLNQPFDKLAYKLCISPHFLSQRVVDNIVHSTNNSFLSVHKGGLGDRHRCRTDRSTHHRFIHYQLDCLLRNCLRDKCEHRHGGIRIYPSERLSVPTLCCLNVRVQIVCREWATDQSYEQPN